MADRLYLDHNATSPLRPQVRDAMVDIMTGALNPSSVHTEGRRAKAVLESARATISARLGVTKEGVVFTGSGTEADNLAVFGLVRGPSAVGRLFISAIEHEAIRVAAAAAGVPVETIPVTENGVIDVAWLDERLNSYDAAQDGAFAVCVMAANNETGVLQPTAQLEPIVWPKGGFVVVDAVQAVGKTDLNFDRSGADLMTIAGHKIGGPVGVGAVLMKPGIPLAATAHGGGQEQYRRAGTENIVGITGLAKAVELADPEHYGRLASMRDGIEANLPSEVKVWGQGAARLPNTLCFSAPDFSSETQVMTMDLSGIAISAGSACSSGKVRQSSVLRAMGASEAEAACAIRVSLGWNTQDDAAERFCAAWSKEYSRIAARGAA